MNTNTTEVIKIVTDKIDVAVATLSAKLGVATDHFYPILVKQQSITAITNIAVSLMSVTIFFLIFKKIRSLVDEDGECTEGNEMASAFAIFLSEVSCIFLLVALTNGIPTLLNPEYAAFMDVVKSIK